MIPGGMWDQVGWLEQIRRNHFPAQPLLSRWGATPCAGNGCTKNVNLPHLVGKVTQDGFYCHDCARFLDRLAELRCGAMDHERGGGAATHEAA